MRHVSSALWLVPLAIHIGYILATYSHLPMEVGVGTGNSGTPVNIFLLAWFGIIGAANIAFAFLHIRLPSFDDRMLTVPKQAFWLATADRKEELIDRLRGICEASLVGLNVFFLAIYQTIYQTNSPYPFVTVPMASLVFFFMVLPLFVVVAALLITLRGLIVKAEDNKRH